MDLVVTVYGTETTFWSFGNRIFALDGKIEELKSGWTRFKHCMEKISMLASLAASTGDEGDKMIDHSRSAHLRAHMAKMVTWSMQTNSSSGFESQSFRATRKNISRGGQHFPVVWMNQICQLSLKCCGSKVV